MRIIYVTIDPGEVLSATVMLGPDAQDGHEFKWLIEQEPVLERAVSELEAVIGGLVKAKVRGWAETK